MDVPELLKTETFILHECVDAHYMDCTDTGAKDIELIIDVLEYAYTSHDSRDQLPSRDELGGIVSRAYDEDVKVKIVLDEAKGRIRSYDDSLPYGQREGYTGLVVALRGYLLRRIAEDKSECVSTPERAKAYVAATRNFNDEISKDVLGRLDKYDKKSNEKEAEDIESMRLEVKRGIADFSAQSDAEIIAEASVPYKVTESGRKSFESLKSLVDEVVQYHRLP